MTIGCGGSSPNSPQAPSNVPAVTSVTVTATSTGSQFQCAAVAGFSDGSTQNVTSQAAWTSSNPSVATVTNTGLVTPLSNGSIDIAATHSGMTGTLRLAVTVPPPSPAPTYTLSGTVRDGSTGTALRGAQAEVIDGPDAGKIATTDGSGWYVLAGLKAGQFRMYFRNSGYDTLAATVSLSGDQTLDVAVSRTPSPPPAPPPTGSYTLTGVIRATPLNEILNDARVEAIRNGAVEVSWNTDSSGAYRLPGLAPARYLLRMTKLGYHATDQEVVISGDASLNLVMDRNRVTIQGFVDEAQPCTGTVQGTRVQVVDGPDAGKFGLNDQPGFWYRIEGVAWGRFTLRASKLPAYPAQEFILNVDPPLSLEGVIVTQHFRLPNPTGRFVLSGKVSSAVGEPAPLIEDALVEIVAGPNSGRSTRSGSAGLGNGVYRFEKLVSGVFELSVSKTGFVTEPYRNGVLCGDTLSYDIKLTPTNAP